METLERLVDAVDLLTDVLYFGGAIVLLSILALIYMSTPARATDDPAEIPADQHGDHRHGEDGIPDWYDSNCCNKHDCHPVEDGTITFQQDELGAPIVVYTVNGVNLVYSKTQWRVSKDERFHACHNGITPLCVYLRPGA